MKGLGLLIEVLITVESGGNDYAIGDEHLARPAYGPLQIRQPVCDDYNRTHGTEYRAKDLLGQRARSIKICRWYLIVKAPKKLLWRAKKPEEIYARTWNGGPNGARKPTTLKYWHKVERELSRDRERRKPCGRRRK